MTLQALGDLAELRTHIQSDDGAAVLQHAEDLLREQADVRTFTLNTSLTLLTL